MEEAMEQAPLDDRIDELLAAAGPNGRVIVGVAGPPGAGKSTLAARLAETAAARHGPGTAVVLPMDGFHLANEVLEALGRRDRKGASDTFDGDGFAALVDRVARRHDPVVYAPRFDRSREEAIAGAIPIAAAARLVVVEGNYLLLADEPWCRVGRRLTEGWYLDTSVAVCEARLRARAEGTYGAAGLAWVEQVDRPNAAVVAVSRSRAHRTIPG